MELKFRMQTIVDVPDETVIVKNDTHLTFARKTGSNTYLVHTCEVADFGYGLTYLYKWTEFTKQKLQAILKIK